MTMFDSEIHVGSWGSVLLVLTWVTTLGLVVTCVLTDEIRFGVSGLCCSALGAALMIIKDNDKTRRVVRAVARETPVRAVRD